MPHAIGELDVSAMTVADDLFLKKEVRGLDKPRL